MRYVTQHFLRLCLPPVLLMTLQAQEGAPETNGGGAITAGGRRLEFKPMEAVAGSPQGGLRAKVLRLKGTLQTWPDR